MNIRNTSIKLSGRKKEEIKDTFSESKLFKFVQERDIFTANVKVQYGKKEITLEMVLSVHEGQIIQLQHRKNIEHKLKTDKFAIKDITFIKKIGVTNRNVGYSRVGLIEEKEKRNIRTGNYE